MDANLTYLFNQWVQILSIIMIFFKNYGCTIIFVKISRCKCTHPNYTPGLTKVGGEDQSSCILTVCQECWVISLAGSLIDWVPWHPLILQQVLYTSAILLVKNQELTLKNKILTLQLDCTPSFN